MTAFFTVPIEAYGIGQAFVVIAFSASLIAGIYWLINRRF